MTKKTQKGMIPIAIAISVGSLFFGFAWKGVSIKDDLEDEDARQSERIARVETAIPNIEKYLELLLDQKKMNSFGTSDVKLVNKLRLQ